MKHIMFLLTITLLISSSCKSEEERRKEEVEKQSTKIISAALVSENFTPEDRDLILKEYVRINADSGADAGLTFAYRVKALITIGENPAEMVRNEKLINESAVEASTMPDSVYEKKLSDLKKNFRIKKDEFKDLEFYHHKNVPENWELNKLVFAYANSNGDVFLVSNYVAENWLFHTSISLVIDGKPYHTQVVERYDPLNKSDHYGGTVWECVTYTKAEEILSAIAKCTDKVIKVRFNGSEFYSDITLPEKQVTGIKETYQLGKMIRRK